MKDNRTGQICESCNSHIISERVQGRIIYECSYCGAEPEDILFDLDKYEDE